MILRAIFVLTVLSSCSTQPVDRTGVPAHYAGATAEDGFRNIYYKDETKNIFSYFKMKWFGGHEWAEHEAEAHKVPVIPVDLIKLAEPKGTQITWLGHSTFLIQINGVNILTDPIFTDYASPVSFAGPKRLVPHMMDYNNLPKIHHVVISHSHYDHLDQETIEFLGEVPTYHVPLQLGEILEDWLPTEGRVIEYDWWQSRRFDGVEITALPVQHWSARGLFDRMDTLWASWLVKSPDESVYFGGDTGYNERLFNDIAENITSIDIALLPIGAYAPRDFMQSYHINPEEALRIHKQLNIKHSVAMHYGTFPLAADGPMAPVARLEKALASDSEHGTDFRTIKIGESISF